MRRTHDNGRRPDDLGSDAIFDFIREQLPNADLKKIDVMKRGWKPAPQKIAAIASACVLLVVGAGLVIASGQSRIHVPTGGTEVAVADVAAPTHEEVWAYVSLLEGSAVLHQAGRRVILNEGDVVAPGDTLESGPEAAVGISYPDGTALVLDGEARLNVRDAAPTGLRVGLVYGTLAARVPPEHGAPLRVTCTNAELTVRGTVFSVHAERGRLTDATVSQGEIEVRTTRDDRAVRIGRMRKLDVDAWSVSDGAPRLSSLNRLAKITPGVVVPAQPKMPEISIKALPKPLSITEKIQKALDQRDDVTAVKIADQNVGSKSVTFNLLAGEAYRRVGRWQDAVDAYLAGAESGAGSRAEKAMLRAADITLRKLLKAAKAAKIIDSYLDRFPAGRHMDEALYLGGVAYSKSGNYKKSRGLFETYLVKYPKGPQSVRVHLALAKILALKMSDCAGASKHIQAVKAKAPKPLAEQADKISAHCTKSKSAVE